MLTDFQIQFHVQVQFQNCWSSKQSIEAIMKLQLICLICYRFEIVDFNLTFYTAKGVQCLTSSYLKHDMNFPFFDNVN